MVISFMPIASHHIIEIAYRNILLQARIQKALFNISIEKKLHNTKYKALDCLSIAQTHRITYTHENSK